MSIATITLPFDPKERAVWYYTKDYHPILLPHVDAFVRKQINTLYMSTGADGDPQGGWDSDPTKRQQYIDFINYAKSKGLKVFGSTLEDPSFVLSDEAGLRNWFGGYVTNTKEFYDTYIIDVEPHTINLIYGNQYPSWTYNKRYYYDNYIRMSRILRQIADEEGVRFIDVIPPWYHAEMVNLGIAGGCNNLSGHSINLMAYSTTATKILSDTKKIRTEVGPNHRLLIAFNIDSANGDPYVLLKNIARTIKTLTVTNGLPLAIFYATQKHFFDQADNYFRI